MSEDKGKYSSLINVGDFGPAAQTLVDRVSNAIGVYFEPHRIVRRAKAEAKANEIDLLSKLKLEDTQRRAAQRLLHEETKKQSNIDNITQDALESLEQDAQPENIEEPWLDRFLDKAKDISEADAQKIWAKVLAGEAKAQGSFSLRALDILYNLDKKDAETFTLLCRFGWDILGYEAMLQPMVFDLADPIYADAGLTYFDLIHLDSLGLISFHTIAQSTYSLNSSDATGVLMTYKGEKPIFVRSQTGSIKTGLVLLTRAGNELSKVCDAPKIEGFSSYCKKKWRQQKCETVDAISELVRPDEVW